MRVAGNFVESDSAFMDVYSGIRVVGETVDAVDVSMVEALSIDTVFLTVGVARVPGVHHDVGVERLGAGDIQDKVHLLHLLHSQGGPKVACVLILELEHLPVKLLGPPWRTILVLVEQDSGGGLLIDVHTPLPHEVVHHGLSHSKGGANLQVTLVIGHGSASGGHREVF